MLDVPAGTSLWQWLDGRDTARMNRYRKYLAFYEGDQWDERRRAGERRLTVNYARTLVRKAASYLMPRPVTFDIREQVTGKMWSRDLGVGGSADVSSLMLLRSHPQNTAEKRRNGGPSANP